MCGIIAYLGERKAQDILLTGLKRLEYRGYDSAGIATLNGDIRVIKRKGKVSELEAALNGQNLSGSVGIGHTRWATHGEPNNINAHPHLSSNGRLALVHNGIIENYSVLKDALRMDGVNFVSETDTEVLVQLIHVIQEKDNLPVEEAVRIALTKVIGAYAIVVIDREDPGKIVAARQGSPLVIGIGDNEFLIASDASPIVEYTQKVVYLNDKEIAIIELENGLKVKSISNKVINPYIEHLNLQIEQLEKGNFEHYMLKEIFEQPETLADCMRGRLKTEFSPTIKLGGLEEYENRILQARRMVIAACGTSWHAALIGEYLIEHLARIPVEVEYASEFRYRNPILNEEDFFIAISQSGETADTLAALELANTRQALTYGIVNVVGSSISRNTHAGSYIHAGPEIGVASTKAFTGSVTLLTMMAMALGFKRGTISKSYHRELQRELEEIPAKIREVLKVNDQIRDLAGLFIQANNALYLGRGYNFPVALEGALKLKEISYIHAEGYPAAEMKHGPIALIDENMPVVVLATNKSAYGKVLSNIQEVKARSGIVLAIVTKGDTEIKKIADYTIEIPETPEPLSPLVSVVPLQLLAYHVAVLRGCNVDQPRNLAKSVTVE